MANENTIITFRLKKKTPTTYELSSGGFIEYPAHKKILNEFTSYSEDGKPKRLRFIKNSNTLDALQQDKNNEKLVLSRDILMFTNGLMLLDSNEDYMAIEYMREMAKHKAGDFFEEVIPEEQGAKQLSDMRIESEAKDLVWKLEIKGKDGITYNEDKLMFMSNLFGIEGGNEPAEQMALLLKKAESDPKNFIRKLEEGYGKIEKQIAASIEHGIIVTTDKSADFKKLKKNIYSESKKVEPLERLSSHFLNPINEEDYKYLLSELEIAEKK